MKLNKFFMGILGALALTACSSDDVIEVPNTPGDPGDVNSRFMTVRIRNANSNSTRAGGDQTDGYEEGLDYENQVSSVRFYFFDEKGEPYKVSYTGLSYVDCTDVKVAENGTSSDITTMPNIEKQLEAMIVLTSTDPQEDFSGIKAMVAIANNHLIADQLGSENKSLAQLKELKGDYSISTIDNNSSNGQFVMTSSSFGASPTDGKSLNYGCEVEVIKDKHIKGSREDAAASPVEIYIERLVAKVRVTASWDNSMVTKKVKFNGKEYVAVQLKSKKANNSTENITTKVLEGDNEVTKNIYLLFNGWDLSGVVKESYLFKKVNNDWDLGWEWNDPSKFRSYWATNTEKYVSSHPEYPRNFEIYTHDNALKNKVGSILYDPENLSRVQYDGTALYCLENAAEKEDGTKSEYVPDETTRNRTVAYISGKLVTLDDENATTPIASVIDYAEWGGNTYTESDLIKAMFAPSENILYTRDEEPYEIEYFTNEDGSQYLDPETNKPVIKIAKYHYYALTVDNVVLVSAENAGKADNNTENSKRYLSYIILKDEIVMEGKKLEKDENGKVKLYQDNGKGDEETPYAPITWDEANNLLTSVPGAKVWRDGDVYYYTDLRHLGTDSEKGAIGVVRNHIYEVQINSVFGLGTPVLNPKDGEGFITNKIDPQKPQKDAYYLGARINILSWRVVNNNTSLDW